MYNKLGFVTADFWYKFAYPLLQVGQRVFTCATTPPSSGSFFSVFVDKVVDQNAVGDFFFRMINHSLVCQACHELGVAHKCVHKLGLIPPWKSLLRFTVIHIIYVIIILLFYLYDYSYVANETIGSGKTHGRL